jgi:LMBR1 domain-containing protein 1
MASASDIWLIIAAIILSFIILVVSALIMINFGHPDDKNVAWVPKIVTITGLFMAAATVLAMPFDVANSQGNGGLNTTYLWYIIFIIDAVYLLFILPFAFFYYESDFDRDMLAREERKVLQSQGCVAFGYTLMASLVFIIIMVVMYVFLGTAEIPVAKVTQSNTLWVTDTGSVFRGSDNYCATSCARSSFNWTLPITLPIYIIAMLSFVGWFLFAIFVGVGLVALPADLINDYLTRPIPLSKKDYALKRIELGKRAQQLKEIAQDFAGDVTDLHHKKDRGTKKMDRKTQNRLENAVYVLKNEYKAAQVAFIERGGNPIWYWFKLSIGVMGAGISLSWILHIGIYMLPKYPPSTFLNQLFIGLTIPGFALFGVLAFTFYSFYLLWCGIKGNFRLGLRIPYLIKIYPMELNNTMMNAFLFNTWIVLLISLPTLQFSATAFPVYARLTQVNLIFGVQIRYLKFFTYFFSTSAFIIAMLVIVVLTTSVMGACPRDRALAIDRKIKDIATGKDDDDE